MSNLVNKFLEAMDIVVDQKLAKSDRDITVQAKVLNKNENGLYSVEYNQKTINDVHAQDLYKQGDDVFMLVPEGNWSNEKTIIGRIHGDIEEAYAYTDLDDIYDLVGQNLITAGANTTLEVDASELDPNSAQPKVEILWSASSTSNKLTLAINNEASASLLFDIYLKQYHKFRFSAECKYSMTDGANYSTADYGIKFKFANGKSVELNINDISGNPYNSGDNFIFQSKFFMFTEEEVEALGNLTDIELFAMTGVTFSIKNLTIYGVANPSDSPYDLVFHTPNGIDASSNPVIEAYVRNDGNKVEDISNIDFKWFIQDKGAKSGWRKVQDSTADNFSGDKDKLTLSSDLVWLTKSVLKCQVTQNGVVFDKELDITHSGRPKEKYIKTLTQGSSTDNTITLTLTFEDDVELPEDYSITVEAFNSAKNSLPAEGENYTSDTDDVNLNKVNLTGLIKYPESIEYRCTLKTKDNIYLDSASIIIGAEIHYPTTITTYYLCTPIDQLSKLPDWPDGQFTINKAKWKTGSEIEGFNAINKYLWTCEEVTFNINGTITTITTMPALLTVWEDEYLDTTFTLTKYYQVADSIIDAPEMPATNENGVISEGGFGNWGTGLPNNNYIWGFDYLYNSTLNKAFSTMPECFYYVAGQDDAPSYETITMYCGLPQVTNGYLDFDKLPSPRPDNKLQMEESTISETSIVGIIDKSKPINIDNIFGQWDQAHGNCSCSINNKEITITQGTFISGQLESYWYSPQFTVKKDTSYIFEADIKFNTESTESIIKEGEIWIAHGSDSRVWANQSFGTNSHLQLKCTPSTDKIMLRLDANSENTTYTISNIQMYEIEEQEYILPSTYEAFSTKEFNGLTHKWFWSSDINDIIDTNSKFIYSTSQNVFNGNITEEGWSECRVHAIYTDPGYNYNVDSWNLYLLGNPDGKEGVFYPRDENGDERVVINASLIQAGELRVRKGDNDILYARMDQDEEGNEDPKVTIAGWEATENSFYSKSEEGNEVALYGKDSPSTYNGEKVRIKIGSPATDDSIMTENLTLLLSKDNLAEGLSESDIGQLEKLDRGSDIHYVINNTQIRNYSADYYIEKKQLTLSDEYPYQLWWGRESFSIDPLPNFSQPESSKIIYQANDVGVFYPRVNNTYYYYFQFKYKEYGYSDETLYSSAGSIEFTGNNDQLTGTTNKDYEEVQLSFAFKITSETTSSIIITASTIYGKSYYSISDMKIELVSSNATLEQLVGTYDLNTIIDQNIPFTDTIVNQVTAQKNEEGKNNVSLTFYSHAYSCRFDLSEESFNYKTVGQISFPNSNTASSIGARTSSGKQTWYDNEGRFTSNFKFNINLTTHNSLPISLSEDYPYFKAYEFYQIVKAKILSNDGANIVVKILDTDKEITITESNPQLNIGEEILIRFSSDTNSWKIYNGNAGTTSYPVEVKNTSYTPPPNISKFLIKVYGDILISGSFYSKPANFMVTESGKFFAFDGTLYGPLSTTGLTFNYKQGQIKTDTAGENILLPLASVMIMNIEYYIYCKQKYNAGDGVTEGDTNIGIMNVSKWGDLPLLQ